MDKQYSMASFEGYIIGLQTLHVHIPIHTAVLSVLFHGSMYTSGPTVYWDEKQINSATDIIYILLTLISP